jgi:hypothetical protein
MTRPLFQMEYFDTYHFCTVVHRLITNPFPYLRTLDEFWGDSDGEYSLFVRPFPKSSALHRFIGFVLDKLFYEAQNEIYRGDDDWLKNPNDDPKLRKFYVNAVLDTYDLQHQSFAEWLNVSERASEDVTDDDVFDYYQKLQISGPLDELFDRIVDEVFFILFMNRQLLQRFNEEVSNRIVEVDPEYFGSDTQALFKKPGVLRRVSIPTWAKRAVFFRDRGRCTLCQSDMSGLLSLLSSHHLDHIVPLAKGGANDVTNLQLLCDVCNLKKSAGRPLTSKLYEKWY